MDQHERPLTLAVVLVGDLVSLVGQAQGVTSGGQLPAGQNTNCSVATPVTWFQPINPLSSRFGLTLTLG